MWLCPVDFFLFPGCCPKPARCSCSRPRSRSRCGTSPSGSSLTRTSSSWRGRRRRWTPLSSTTWCATAGRRSSKPWVTSTVPSPLHRPWFSVMYDHKLPPQLDIRLVQLDWKSESCLCLFTDQENSRVASRRAVQRGPPGGATQWGDAGGTASGGYRAFSQRQRESPGHYKRLCQRWPSFLRE